MAWSRLVVVLFVAGLVSGCLGSDGENAPVAGSADTIERRADVVVAFIDSGVNPYHVAFRDDDPRALQHPSAYLAGYPTDALPLDLTLDAPDYDTAVEADCALWRSTQAGRLYYVPGTKIVGMIDVQGTDPIDCSAEKPRGGVALDGAGHGTMVATKVAHPDYGSCPDCRVVAIKGYNIAALEWSAANAHWIDVESDSWGPNPVPMHDALPNDLVGGETQTFARAVEASAQKHLALWASSNGIYGSFGVIGHPSLLRMKLPPSTVIVGAHDSGQVTTWHGFSPHVVSDGCQDWAGEHDSIDGSNEREGGGTSSATPYVAGASGQILLEARRILGDHGVGIHDGSAASGEAAPGDGPLFDGAFTLEEWKEVLLKTADPRPTRQEEDGPPCFLTGLYDPLPVMWDQVPSQVPGYVNVGYGSVDRASVALAVEVLKGTEPLPERPEEERYFEMDATARQAIYDAFTDL